MKVNDFDRYILSYLDGDLSSSEAEDFEKIMEDNPECKEKFINHQNIAKELSNIENLHAPEGFSNRLYTKIDEISPGFIDRNRLNKKIDSLHSNPNKSMENSFFQYNYMSIIRIAAGLAIVVFSVSIFFNSNNMSNSDSNRSLSATGRINGSDMADNSEDPKLDSNNVDIPLEYENSPEGSFKQVKHKE